MTELYSLYPNSNILKFVNSAHNIHILHVTSLIHCNKHIKIPLNGVLSVIGSKFSWFNLVALHVCIPVFVPFT